MFQKNNYLISKRYILPPIPYNQNITQMIKKIGAQRLSITTNFIAELYRSKNKLNLEGPILQILDFEQGSSRVASEIIIRISDTETFVDCSLIGPYSIEKNKIVCCENGENILYEKFDIIKMADYFSKIDPTRICQLRIIIRKLQIVQKCSKRQGFPYQVGQYYHNTLVALKKGDQKSIQISEDLKAHLLMNGSRSKQDTEISKKKISDPLRIHVAPNIQIISKPKKIIETIKIQDDAENPIPCIPIKDVNQMKLLQQLQLNIQQQQLPITPHQVLQGKQGFFIGRLIRIKLGSKQTKDGQITVLSIGMINKDKQILRINIVGRSAVRQAKQLKKGKCYKIQGFDLYKTEKMQYAQLKLKQKEGKITELPIQTKSNQYLYQYFEWQHENHTADGESVDVIGIVDEIEEIIRYPQSGSKQIREVIRIIIRNNVKTVKISFWAQQMQALKTLKLRKKQPVIFEDIKKKKNMFLDYTVQSSFLRLEENQILKNKFADLLPQCQPEDDPINLKQLDQFYESYPQNNKVRNFRFYLTRLQQNRILYKSCTNCKIKADRFAESCANCNLKDFVYKFNCQAELTDFSGTASCVLFDCFAKKIFNKSAAQINDLDGIELQELIGDCLYTQYIIGIEYKNLRLIVRDITVQSPEEMTRKNLDLINQRLSKNKQ